MKYKVQSFLMLLFILNIQVAQSKNINKTVACISVKDPQFGAKGDGITDDTKAIHAAFAAATDCVYFPAGVYLIDPDATAEKQMFLLKSNMIVRGDKGLSVLKIKDNSIVSQALPRPNLLEQMLLGGENVNNVTIENLIFDCNYRGNTNQVNAMVHETQSVLFFGVNTLKIKDCRFINSGQAGLVLIKCQNSTLMGNYFYDVGQGKFNADAIQTNGCTNTVIDNNVLENVGEGIFCQHHHSTRTPDVGAKVTNNKIRTLEANEPSQMPYFINQLALSKMNVQSLIQNGKAGRAIGAGIGILSNNSFVSQNQITKHNGIAVLAYKGHGDLGTSDVEIRNNTIWQNAKIKYFDEKQNKFIRNSNGAFVVSADGQTVKNVIFVNNQVQTSFNSGFDLVISQVNTNNILSNGILENITIDGNTIDNACADTLIDKSAAIDFRNVGFTQADNKNKFRQVTIRNNRLGYGYKGNGLWFEPCMSNVRVINNTFVGNANAKINAAPRSCLREINDPGDFIQNELNCLLEPGGVCVGCTSSPAACLPNGWGCLICN